ncbi:anti-sigma factor [Sulfitobacter pacificus]|uniref:Anti-sigma K factor RskA n=1 Tax=Sulfitobacter pacificus TaxID=1499314 RepID=A0ABQ5VF65_9RHOB|nr:anti-sigma factor [Sulfitobacter pacificus]GLQ25810.1 anti-sigma K factor RskA [Sulfitobacter pacificus]
MSEEDFTPRDAEDAMAAEYVLGLATGDVLAEAQTRAAHDAAFAQRVASWQERMVQLTDSIDPVAPPKKVKRLLLKSLFPRVSVPLMQRLWVWQGIALAALVLAAYLATPLLQPKELDVPRDVYATQMSSPDFDLQVIAVVDTRNSIALRRLAGQAPADRVLELWAILPDQAPISLGVLPEGESARIPLPQALAEQIATITLAITDEPLGGAPGGVPSGSIRAAGEISAL